MKKKIILVAALTLVLVMTSACGRADSGNAGTDNTGNEAQTKETGSNKGDDEYIYVNQISADEYITLGEYKGIELNEIPPSVPDGYVSQYIDTYILAPRAKVTPIEDRTDVQEGDTVNIDYVGYRDGEAFDGGTAQGYDLTIGSGAFIPGFEDGLIGKNVGETVTLDLTFPSDYRNTEMAGVAVSFEVTINSISISEIPELTDELVKELELEDCSTVEELNDYLNEYFYSAALNSYNNTVKNDITGAVLTNCTFKKEIPDKMVDRYYDMLIEDMTATAESSGMDLNSYVKEYYNMDEAEYTERVRNNAVTMAQQYIMFKAIADAEGLNITDESMAQELEKMAERYGDESVEMIKEEMGEEAVNEYLMAEAVVDFLIENAKINTNEAE